MSRRRRTGRAMAGVALVATASLALAACGGGSGEQAGGGGGAAPAAGPVKVAAVIKGLDNPFFQLMQRGIEDESAAGGAQTTVQAATGTSDTTGQADKLAGLANQDFGCYIVNPITGSNLVQGLAQVAAADKPIVNIDSPVDAAAADAAGARIATYIGTDNVAAGGLAAREITRVLPSGGEVALVSGPSGDVTSNDRLSGFTQGLTPAFTVVQTVAANWERQTALTQATDVMRANPNLKVIFAANDDMGLGVIRAIANEGRTGQIQVLSVDGNPDAFSAVASGELAASIAQYPYVVGQLGIAACRAAAGGATLPAKVDSPVLLVNKDNVQQAIASAPKPPVAYDNPFTPLINS